MNFNKSDSSNDEEISLIDLFLILWKRKFFILFLTSIFAVGSVFYALSVPNIYRSEALLVPNVSSSSGISSSMGGFSSLAGIAGINLSGPKGDKKREAIAILTSHQFLENFIMKNDLLIPLMAAKSWDKEKNILVLNSKIYDETNSEWVKDKNGKENNSIQLAVRTFKEKFGVTEIAKTGFVKIHAESYSPYVAKEWVDLLVADINEHMRYQEVAAAEKSLKFLKEQANKTNVNEIKKVISELIKSDIQTLTLSSSSDEYVFKTIDRAIVPEFKFAPKRAFICIAITMLGGIFSVMFAFLSEYLKSRKLVE